jgi:hypothetical protein
MKKDEKTKKRKNEKTKKRKNEKTKKRKNEKTKKRKRDNARGLTLILTNFQGSTYQPRSLAQDLLVPPAPALRAMKV